MEQFVTAMRKPSLPEMLAEPIVRMVMARDGVRGRDLVAALARARAGIAGRGLVSTSSGVSSLPEPRQPRL